MSESEKTRQYLPVVSPEVDDVIVQNVVEYGISNRTDAILEKFRHEQPHLSAFVEAYIDRFAADEDVRTKMFTIALMMYELLAVQAEADAMDEQFNIS